MVEVQHQHTERHTMTTPTDALPEPVQRVLGYAGKVRNQVTNPCITSQETILIANWFKAALATQAEARSPITDATYLGLAEDIARLTADCIALRAERDALKADAAALDWIECRAMNGRIQVARLIMGTGYEIAVIERGGPMTVTVELGTLRQALASRAARTGGKA
jgi:hypothetical protein